MLTQLPTVKARLALVDTTFDDTLTNAIAAVSDRFDAETNRTLARTENFTQEFDAASTEVVASCYPIESVSKFEFKISEASGWQEITPTPDFLIRSSCIISLAQPINYQQSTINSSLARVTYTGGYVPPSDPDYQLSAIDHPPFRLPDDLESAAVEQVAYWFQTRDNLGLKTVWPRDGAYRQFAQLPLIVPVQSVLNHYKRWTL